MADLRLEPSLPGWVLWPSQGEKPTECFLQKGWSVSRFVKKRFTDAFNFPLLLPPNSGGFCAPPSTPPPPQIRCHRTQTSPLPAGQSRHLVGDCILALSCPRPPGPAGRQEAEEGGGPIPLRASFCRSLVPNCPPGSDPSRHGCAPSGVLSRRVKWPAASGRWEPVTAIFNLIKAVSTIDFGSFNY